MYTTVTCQFFLAIESAKLKRILQTNLQDHIDFFVKQTKINHRRADHLEVANLALLHLGANPGYQVKKPGPDHHARWLSKVLYIFKMLLFREHFLDMNLEITEKFETFLLYFITIYLKYWFTCEPSKYAAKNDLDFLTDLASFAKIPGKYFSEVAHYAIETQNRHLQYLDVDNAIFAIFDERICVEEKEQLRLKLIGKSLSQQKKTIEKYLLAANEFNDENEEDELGNAIDFNDSNADDLFESLTIMEQQFEEDLLEDFENNCEDFETNQFFNHAFDKITENSLKTLTNFGINVNFFLENAINWDKLPSYQEAVKIVENIKSTSIFTEQMVGRVSRLHDLSLVRDKHNLESLAFSAFSYPINE